MLLSQFLRDDGRIQLVAREGSEAFEVATSDTLYDLARACAATGEGLRERVLALGLSGPVDLEALYDEHRLLPPLTHPDPAHLWLTGTGLTHLGAAVPRAEMPDAGPDVEAAEDSDAMRMFRMGVEGGKPRHGIAGVQPEWFFKGTGVALVAPGAALTRPAFAEDGGEEPEVAGLYVVAEDGTPVRIGFALANEFSDHVMERRNALYLSHSKLRQASVGPEVLISDLPETVAGISRIRRGNELVFEAPFLTGETNMSHSLANLEHHHFKYDVFRQPGDVHIHMFGTATLSFSEGVMAQAGDVFEIEAEGFGLPLRNPLAVSAKPSPDRAVEVQTL
ncbi:GguC family protein [Psychromarinibacter sp. C21-152]|uniref:GguC family protein n=1 Tax=Psychromarinibacter sediminicola TaxID=3033385 RepID=A0AAE3NNP1_9RHOB|nr:AraD1 family protein [Psychromarinibacter sediminicola]MDF0599616.1 GguC family protein [Psychromarinibacter sediminicola]